MTVKPQSLVISAEALPNHVKLPCHLLNKMNEVQKSVQHIVEEILNEHSFAGKDGLLHSMDAPHCNEPSPTWTRPAAVAIYFGENQNLINEEGTVWRAAYGTGTGASSVGRDPRDFCVMYYGSRHRRVAAILKECVRATAEAEQKTCGNISSWQNITQLTTSTSYNFLEMKVYLNGKKLGAHCDVLYCKDGKLSAGNTQRENTPVLVYSVGCARILVMERQECELDKTTRNFGCWKNTGERTEFKLSPGSIFLLHPEDEIPSVPPVGEEPPVSIWNKNKRSRFRHSVKPVKSGVSIAFVFRSVTGRLKVDARSGKRRNLSERDLAFIEEKQFDLRQEKIWNHDEKKLVLARVQSMLEQQGLIQMRNPETDRATPYLPHEATIKSEQELLLNAKNLTAV